MCEVTLLSVQSPSMRLNHGHFSCLFLELVSLLDDAAHASLHCRSSAGRHGIVLGALLLSVLELGTSSGQLLNESVVFCRQLPQLFQLCPRLLQLLECLQEPAVLSRQFRIAVQRLTW